VCEGRWRKRYCIKDSMEYMVLLLFNDASTGGYPIVVLHPRYGSWNFLGMAYIRLSYSRLGNTGLDPGHVWDAILRAYDKLSVPGRLHLVPTAQVTTTSRQALYPLIRCWAWCDLVGHIHTYPAHNMTSFSPASVRVRAGSASRVGFGYQIRKSLSTNGLALILGNRLKLKSTLLICEIQPSITQRTYHTILQRLHGSSKQMNQPPKANWNTKTWQSRESSQDIYTSLHITIHRAIITQKQGRNALGISKENTTKKSKLYKN
jgi:hypothetical protein